jgi:murein DD-endopeptidase MepM/ murein hydrolase activator NlpD
MKSERYYFNRETLQFEKVQTNYRRIFIYAALIAIVSISVRYLIDDSFNSPKVRHFTQENQKLRNSYLLLNEQIAKSEVMLSDIQQRDDYVYRSVFDLEPIPSSVREAGFGGSDEYSIDLESRNSEFVTNTALMLEKLSTKARIQSGSLDHLYRKAKEQKLLLTNKPSIQPISPADHVWLTSTYGYRKDPFHKRRKMHHGIDLAGQVGIKIYATGNGIVKTAAFNRWGYGNEIIIDHGFAFESIYAHLDKIYVKKGEFVKKGQLIGTLGDTGRSTGPHLHYEIRKNKKAVNPMYYFYENLSAPEYSLITTLNK